MTRHDDRNDTATELQVLLDAWGGEPARWPPKVRLRIAELSVESRSARRTLQDAIALDRLLDTADDPSSSASAARTRALTDRIMAAAEPGITAAAPVRDAEIIELPRRQPVAMVPAAGRSSPALPAIAGRRWHTAGLLAASMLAGIYVGGSVNVAPVVQELAEAVGFSAGVDGALSGLGDDIDDEEAP